MKAWSFVNHVRLHRNKLLHFWNCAKTSQTTNQLLMLLNKKKILLLQCVITSLSIYSWPRWQLIKKFRNPQATSCTKQTIVIKIINHKLNLNWKFQTSITQKQSLKKCKPKTNANVSIHIKTYIHVYVNTYACIRCDFNM